MESNIRQPITGSGMKVINGTKAITEGQTVTFNIPNMPKYFCMYHIPEGTSWQALILYNSEQNANKILLARKYSQTYEYKDKSYFSFSYVNGVLSIKLDSFDTGTIAYIFFY